MATAIHKGSITRDIYFAFIQNEVLPYCNQWPAPRSVLVMDNASIHYNAEFQAMVVVAGVILEYLPLYLLDFNPIKLSFYELKAWIRRNRQLIDDFDDFGLFLKFAVNSCSSWKQAISHFRRCFVDVTGYDQEIELQTPFSN
jgi:transposase